MNIQRILITLLLALAYSIGPVNSQTESKSFQEIEDTLLTISPWVISSNTDSAKFAVANQLQEKLASILLDPASFDYEFSNLRMSTVAVASHPKSPVRLFTYNIILKNGVFHHYGVLQHKTKQGVSVYLLHDTAQALPNEAKDITLTQNQWIGGLYYQIFPHKIKKKQYYIVMLFDGHNVNSNRSIIDVLSFEPDEEAPEPGALKLVWGAPIFRDGTEDPSEDHRVIFEYHKSSRILMRYEEEKNIIVFDEIGPAFPSANGNLYYYIPTGDYSGYKPSKRGIFTKEPLEATDFGQGIPNPTIFR
jgi:hypothetical protein